MPPTLLTDHHVIPREEGGGPQHKVPMCRACHRHVHATYDNRTLAQALNTVDALRRDPQLQKFVRFIRKQSPTSTFGSSTARGRRRR